MEFNSDVITSDVSDHFAVLCTMAIEKERSPASTRTIRLMGSKNIISFKAALQKISWSELYTCHDVNKLTSLINSAILEKLDECCPIKTIRCKTVNKITNEWFSSALEISAKEKVKLHKLWIK